MNYQIDGNNLVYITTMKIYNAQIVVTELQEGSNDSIDLASKNCRSG